VEEGGPDGCRFVVEEGKLEDRAVLAQLGSVGRIMAQARAAVASTKSSVSAAPCAGHCMVYCWGFEYCRGLRSRLEHGQGGVTGKYAHNTAAIFWLCSPQLLVHMLRGQSL